MTTPIIDVVISADWSFCSDCGHDTARDGEHMPYDVGEWAAHVAAALREARTITEQAQLDPLPVGTVVRDTGPYGWVWERVANGEWLYIGDVDPQAEPDLPARVLYLPGEDEA